MRVAAFRRALDALLIIIVLLHTAAPLRPVAPAQDRRDEIASSRSTEDTSCGLPSRGTSEIMSVQSRQDGRVAAAALARPLGRSSSAVWRPSTHVPQRARSAPQPVRRILHHRAHHSADDTLPA